MRALLADETAQEAGELWRVFVLLRNRHGVYERAIRASGPLEAELAASMADRDVLATLGSRYVRGDVASESGPVRYRGLQPAGRRFLEVNGDSYSPLVEVLEPWAGPFEPR